MARSFTSTDRIDVGSNAVLDDLLNGTWIAWVFLTSVAPATARIWQKGTGTNASIFTVNSTSGGLLAKTHSRATTNQSNQAILTNFAAYTISTWMCIACVSDDTTAGNNKLYLGNLTTPLAEPSGYTTQSAGSGAVSSDAAANANWGNVATGGSPFSGTLALGAMFNTKLTLAELISWQFNPRWNFGGCVDGHWFGQTGEPDLSGNGNAGTVTGTAIAAHVPLPRALASSGAGI